MSALRELTFFFAVFLGAVMADQHQFDEYQFSAKEQQAFDELFGKPEQTQEQEDE